MATKADFTESEWEALRKGVSGSGMLVSLSDRDFTDTFGEAGALGKYLAGQQVARDLHGLLGRFPLAENHLGHPLAERAIMIDIRESEIFEG